MRLFGCELEGLPKLLVIFTAILLVASGLCGVQWMMQGLMSNGPMAALYMGLGVIELLAIAFSACLIPVLLLLLLVQKLTGWPPRAKSNIQTLLGEKNDE